MAGSLEPMARGEHSNGARMHPLIAARRASAFDAPRKARTAFAKSSDPAIAFFAESKPASFSLGARKRGIRNLAGTRRVPSLCFLRA